MVNGCSYFDIIIKNIRDRKKWILQNNVLVSFNWTHEKQTKTKTNQTQTKICPFFPPHLLKVELFFLKQSQILIF
jgi:hypothetical protein